MKMQQIVGNNIKAFRILRRLTQQELAAKAKSNKAYVGFIERGVRNISLETLTQIADALEVPAYLLLVPDAKSWIKQH